MMEKKIVRKGIEEMKRNKTRMTVGRKEGRKWEKKGEQMMMQSVSEQDNESRMRFLFLTKCCQLLVAV